MESDLETHSNLSSRLERLDDRLAKVQDNIAKTSDVWIAVFTTNLVVTTLAALALWLVL